MRATLRLRALSTAAAAAVQASLRRRGWDVRRSDAYWAHRALSSAGTTIVFDVGAATGQYGRLLRGLGYQGRIVSCEPLPRQYAELEGTAASDPSWTALEVAVSDCSGRAELLVTEFADASSLLRASERAVEATPGLRSDTSITVPTTTLDDLLDTHSEPTDRVFVKLDVQGFEGTVLDGCRRWRSRIVGLQLELSLQEVYSGTASYQELLRRVEGEFGLQLVGLDPGFVERARGHRLQADATFVRLSE